MIKEFDFERKKKQEAEGYDSKRNSNSNLREAGVIAFSNIGLVRKANEDDWGVAKTPNGYLFVVCDGMGGHVGGQEASRIAVECIIKTLQEEKYPNPLQALNEALQFANMQILGCAKNNPELKGMGTTACILLLQGNEAYIAHVGDSRIYLYLGKEKRLHRITRDDSYVQNLVDAGEISDDEAEHHPNKNRILKALGIKPELQPTFSRKPILTKNGDIFLICTDGLNGMISDHTIANVLSHNTLIAEKGKMLTNIALEEGGLDNITLQLIQISDSSYKKSEYKHCDFNPKTKGKSPTIGYNSEKLMKILKWTAVVMASVMLVVGGWYLKRERDESSLKKQIEKKKVEVIFLTNQHSETLTKLQQEQADIEAIRAGNDDVKKKTIPSKEAALKVKEKKAGEKQDKLEIEDKELKRLETELGKLKSKRIKYKLKKT